MNIDLTAGQLLDEVQEAAAKGEYTEELFKKSICHVLNENGVEYETEYPLGPNHPDANARRCDIYIPKTDTAIELKLEASMRGVGQCIYYTRYCHEALLLADGDPPKKGHNAAVRDAVEVATGVNYGLCLPYLPDTPPSMSIRTSDKCEFYHQAAYGDLGETDFLLVKDLGSLNRYSGQDDSGKNSVNVRGEWQAEKKWSQDRELDEFGGGGRR